MKYIKAYENHSLDYSYEDAISIFYPLRDFGYDISVDKETTDDWKMEEDYTEDYVSLIISNENDFMINGDDEEVSELKDCVIRVIEFLKEWSYSLEAVQKANRSHSYSSLMGKDIKIVDDVFVFSKTNLPVEEPINQLKIFFTRKTDKIQESLIEDVKDRFLDLEDDGYGVDVKEIIDRPISFNGEKMIHSNDLDKHFKTEDAVDMIQIIIDRKVRRRRDWGEFTLSEIKDTIESSIDMVSDSFRVDSFYVTTLDKAGGDGFGNNHYFENFNDLPKRVRKLYIYFIVK